MAKPRPEPRYDDRAVDLVVEIEDYLATLGPPLDPLIRRCGAIRRALEMQVEHSEPPVSPMVMELLSKALLEQVRLVVQDSAPLEAKLLTLRQHLEKRTG
jgi:hypothetical protein